MCEEIPEIVRKCKDYDTCPICMKAKQSRLPFNTKRSKAIKPLEITHSDVCGPIDPTTYENKKYFLICVDDYMHVCKIYLLENKNEVYTFLKEYASEAERQLNTKVKRIRCDNGGEYKNNTLRQWCKKKGIVLEFAISYSPQLNGTAKRMNRTIMEKARALIFYSGLDKEMWGEAVLTYAYLSNRSPMVTVNGTPAENWYGTKPNFTRLKIFGSEVHTKIQGPLKKQDSRSKKGIFVGYNTNGYRIWDPNTKGTYVSRDAIFKNEPKIPNKQKQLEKAIQIEDNTYILNQQDEDMEEEHEINKGKKRNQ
jgi:hypothetical protein